MKSISQIIALDKLDTHDGIDIMYVCHDAHYGFEYRGKAYSPIIDSLFERSTEAGLECIEVLKPYSRLRNHNTYNKSANFNRLFVPSTLIGLAKKTRNDRPHQVNSVSEYRSRAWHKILQLVRPKIVVGIQPEPALCLACARNGIPVFDYQHGVINSQHPSYNENWVQSKHKDELPTGIFCWDEPTAKYLREWCSRAGIKVFTAGQPWVDRFLKQKAPIDKDMPFIQSCVDAPTLRNEKRKVLVTLQWGLDRFYDENDFDGVICRALKDVIHRNVFNCMWLLRLHPVQLRGKNKKKILRYLDRTFRGQSEVEWDLASELPLPILLSTVDAHITDCSSVVIEADYFGVQSALLNPHLQKGGLLDQYYIEQRDRGSACLLKAETNVIESWLATVIGQTKLPRKEKAERDVFLEVIEGYLR